MADTDTIKIEGYTLDSILGRGGMSVVYLAHHTGLQRPAAIKVMSQQFLADQTFTDRFIHEARTVAKLRHPNIVTVYDVGSVNELPFMAMEYLSGGDLKSRIKEGIDPATAVKYLNCILETLSYAHSKGCIHRDIKPDNILFDENNELSVVDFGVAKTLASDTSITIAGSIIGTPKYMSPEQGQGRPVTEKSDFYSLGVVFYEMLLGVPPYEADSSVSLMMRHIHDPIPKLPRKFSSFQSLINGLLEKRPDKRLADTTKIEKMARKALERYQKKHLVQQYSNPATPAPSELGDDDKTAIWDGPSLPGDTLAKGFSLRPDSNRKVAIGALAGIGLFGILIYLLGAFNDEPVSGNDSPIKVVSSNLEPTAAGMKNIGQDNSSNSGEALAASSPSSTELSLLDLPANLSHQDLIKVSPPEIFTEEELQAIREEELKAQISAILLQGAFVFEVSRAAVPDVSKVIELVDKAETILPTSEAVKNAQADLQALIKRRITEETNLQNFDEAREFLELAKQARISSAELDPLLENIRQALEQQRYTALQQKMLNTETSSEWQQYLGSLSLFQSEIADHSLSSELIESTRERFQKQGSELIRQNNLQLAEQLLGTGVDIPFLAEEISALQSMIEKSKQAQAKAIAKQKLSAQLKRNIEKRLSQKKFFQPRGGAYQSLLEYRKAQPGDGRYFNSAIRRLTSEAKNEAVQLFSNGRTKESDAIIRQLERHFPQKGTETREEIVSLRAEILGREIGRLLYDGSPSLEETTALLERYEDYSALVGETDAQSINEKVLDKIANDVEFLIYTRNIELGRSILNQGIILSPEHAPFKKLNVKLVQLELAENAPSPESSDAQKSRGSNNKGEQKKLPSLPSF